MQGKAREVRERYRGRGRVIYRGGRRRIAAGRNALKRRGAQVSDASDQSKSNWPSIPHLHTDLIARVLPGFAIIACHVLAWMGPTDFMALVKKGLDTPAAKAPSWR